MKIDSANTALQTGAVKPMNNSEAKNDIQVSDPNQPRMVSGPELVDYVADMFGYDSWSGKGFSLNQDSKEAIFQAFQDAVREASAATSGAGGYGMTLNVHQIVMDHQDVPSWFLKEKEGVDQVVGSELFPDGEYYSIDYKGTYPKAPGNDAYLDFSEHDVLMKHLFEFGQISTEA